MNNYIPSPLILAGKVFGGTFGNLVVETYRLSNEINQIHPQLKIYT